MSDEPIQVELGPFDKLEILREEREKLAQHRLAVERSIREVKFEIERQKLLQSLAAYYRTLQPPEGAARLKQLEELRASVIQAMQAVDQAFADVEKQAGKAGGGGQPGGLESFRRKRPR